MGFRYISVILISIIFCGIAVLFSPAASVVFHPFGYRHSVKEDPSWYWVLFIALSCPIHVSIFFKILTDLKDFRLMVNDYTISDS